MSRYSPNFYSSKTRKYVGTYYVEEFGAIGNYNPTNGTGNDDTDAFNKAIDAVVQAGRGNIGLSPNKSYKLRYGMTWQDGVGVIGAGKNSSKIYPVIGGAAAFYQPGTVLADNPLPYDPDNPMSDMEFRGFSIDFVNSTGGKGILLFFLKHCLFEDINLYNTPLTGMGCDFLDDVDIRRVNTYNCGWTYDPEINNIGRSGIGIGTGAWPIERIRVSDCRCEDSGNFGIFLEKQNYAYTPYISRGGIISNCYVKGSGNAAIADKGVDGMIVKNCEMTESLDGFQVLDGGIGGKIINCNIYNNTQYGIHFMEDAGVEGYYVDSKTKVHDNTKHGILFITTAGVKNAKCHAEVYKNGYNGIQVSAPLTNPDFSNSKLYNNGTAVLGGTNQHGLVFRADITNPCIKNIRAYDDQTVKTQKYGIYSNIDSTVSGGEISENDLTGNLVAGWLRAESSATDLTVRNNKGYSPVAASVAPASSPWTYTAGEQPEVIYIIATTAIESIKINSTVTILTNCLTATVFLSPWASMIVTHAGTSTITSVKRQILS